MVKRQFYITVTSGMSGYFAVMIINENGYEEPYQTGVGRYKKASQAVQEAKAWAKDEGLRYEGPEE